MNDVARNHLLMRITFLLFGFTIYFGLLLMALFRLRGEFPRDTPSRQRSGGCGINLALGFATLTIIVALLNTAPPTGQYEIGRERGAPFALPVFAFAFIVFLGWVGYEFVRTIRWLFRGRPRPPDHLPPPDA